MLRTNRTPSSKYIFYALHVYFSDLFLKKRHFSIYLDLQGETMFLFDIEFQHYKPENTFHRKRRSYEFIVDDETLIIVGNEFVFGCCRLQLN